MPVNPLFYNLFVFSEAVDVHRLDTSARLRQRLVVGKLQHIVPNRVEVHVVFREGDLQVRCLGVGEELEAARCCNTP